MTNSEYWARRIKIAEDNINNRVYEDYVKNIEARYDEAIKALDEKIRAWYQRFAKNNQISYADAQKLLKSNELKEFKWDVEEYIKHGRENGISADWSKELENASARVHVSRLEQIEYKLRAYVEDLTQSNIQGIIDASTLAYGESYYHTAFEIHKQSGVGITMQGIDKDKLNKLFNTPWTADEKTFTARCWTDKNKLVDVVNKELTRMTATGESPDRAIDAIAKQFNVSKSNAGRLVMTESSYISSEAHRDCFEELDVEQYIIYAGLDKTTCDYCSAMDKKVFPMSKYKPGETANPFHPWCRCTTAPYFDDDEGGERFARDVETNKGYYVPKDMTYSEWRKTQPDFSKSGVSEPHKEKSVEVEVKGTEGKYKDVKVPGKSVDKSGESGIISTYKSNGVTVISDSAIPHEVTSRVEQATSKVMSDFRILENQTEPIIYSSLSGALGENAFSLETGRNQIRLNRSAFADPDALLKSLKNDFASGVSYDTDCIESLVAHELGHNTHIALALKRTNIPYGQPLSRIQIEAFKREHLKISQEIYLIAFSTQSYDEIQNVCIGQLGLKTKNDACELIAQSFGNYYYGTEKSSVAKAIVKYFMKGLK